MAEIGLRVNGREYRGWETARVSRSIEALSGTFELGVSERWADQGKPWPINEGDQCSVVVAGKTLITGWVDTRSPSFSADDHTISVSGRDATGDLVDCSALLSSWEFSDTHVLALAEKLCSPFGVRVSLQAGISLPSIALPKKYSIDPGDTVASALENLCRVAGLLAISDGAGGVRLVRAGRERATTALVEGENILAGSAKFSHADRFGTYRVMGSHKGRNDLSGPQAAGVRGNASDLNVRAARVHVVRPEGNVTPAQAKARAEWEASVRAARGDSASVTVAGWTQGDGSLWTPNTIARIKSPRLTLDGDALIAGVTFNASTSGTTTQLDLRAPQAFDPDPTLLKHGGGGNNYWREIVRGV